MSFKWNWRKFYAPNEIQVNSMRPSTVNSWRIRFDSQFNKSLIPIEQCTRWEICTQCVCTTHFIFQRTKQLIIELSRIKSKRRLKMKKSDFFENQLFPWKCTNGLISAKNSFFKWKKRCKTIEIRIGGHLSFQFRDHNKYLMYALGIT